MPVILYLDNVCGVDKKIVVPAHDIAVSKHYLDFIKRDPSFEASTENIVARANNLARNGAIFLADIKDLLNEHPFDSVGSLKYSDIAYMRVSDQDYLFEYLDPEAVKKYYNIFSIIGEM